MDVHSASSNVTYTKYTSAPVIAAVSVFSLVGTVGNGLVLYVFGCRFPKSPFNMLVTCLALFDLLACLIFMPIDVIFMSCPSLLQFRLQLCQFGYVVMDVSIAATSVLLCEIAYTRFRMISCPLKKQVTMRHANRVVGLATALGVLMGLVSFFSAIVVDIPMDSGFVLVDCGVGSNHYDHLL
ncbi:galanin receptor type 3-like [Gigantopelta aegis]|uniref:galanin receptor type 3-like n=1 Tax=Gigantopelta aegis TaxID=1735272 RepID=UPI001B8883B8|nr:galanin receptor type 3-like [Gigantopelta aegis]